MCHDPEGLAVADNGHFFIAEEYHPSVREFNAAGKFVRRFPTPTGFVPRGSAGPDFSADEKDALVAGREPNRGFEGLALLPDGNLATVLQSGLVQDGGREAGSTLLVVYDTESAEVAAIYLLPLADAVELDASAPAGKKIKTRHLVVSSLAALPDGRLLALERDNFGADGSAEHPPARWKAVVLLDLRRADNLLGRADVSGAAPVQRTVLFNLAALDTAAHGLPRTEMPAKWEGLALAAIDGDRVRLLLSSDNDFLSPNSASAGVKGSRRWFPFPALRAPRTLGSSKSRLSCRPFPPPGMPSHPSSAHEKPNPRLHPNRTPRRHRHPCRSCCVGLPRGGRRCVVFAKGLGPQQHQANQHAGRDLRGRPQRAAARGGRRGGAVLQPRQVRDQRVV
jgi:Uncharacterized protein conserved in bacteria